MDESQLTGTGRLQISVLSYFGQIPVEGAKVSVAYSEEPDTVIEELVTDSSGQTRYISLPAPPAGLSLEPENKIRPYSEYNIYVSAPGYEPVLVKGSEILDESVSIQPVRLHPAPEDGSEEEIITISEHALWGNDPPKIPEAEVKPVTETGEIVLSRVVIPEYVIVHDGVPSDKKAKNYWVRYTDYIKNVVSSEVYSTWPESTIYANILAIMSFTLNRVYTEWYRNKGYDFTITSSTAYDQKWIYGRNIYQNISRLVDSVFVNYLSRPGITQPLFASYCDGKNTTCKGLSQWGSKTLGEKGYSAIRILRNYYGNDVFINTANTISGVPSSYPGYTLTVGSRGDKIRQLQQQLNRIAQNYPAIPRLVADGIYGAKTKEAVRTFQSVFHLPTTGNVDFATWYAVSRIYVAVSRIAEPDR